MFLSSLFSSQNKTQIIPQYYKYLTPVYLLKKFLKTWDIPNIIFPIPKQNPADKRYMTQKHLQLKTVAAYMYCSQPGQYRLSNFFQKIQKSVLILTFVILYDFS